MFYGSTFKNSKYVSLLLFKLFSMPDRTFVSSTNYKKRKCTSKNAFKISFIWFMTKDIHNQSLYKVTTELKTLKSEAEFEKFEPQLEYGWFYLKVY